MRINTFLLLLTSFISLSFSSPAQWLEKKMESFSVDPTLATGTQIVVVDPVYPSYYLQRQYQLYVRLSYTRNNRTDLSTTNFTYGLNYSYVLLDQNLAAAASVNGSPLSVTFNASNPNSIVYEQTQLIDITDPTRCGARVTVGTITKTGTVPANEIRLEVQLLVKYLPVTPSVHLFDGAVLYNSTSGEIAWPYQKNASGYQLEWTYIDAESEYSTQAWTQDNFFKVKEPVRLITSNQYAKVNTLYAAGKVYVRIRAVWNYQGINDAQEHYSAWTYLSTPITISNSFEASKNWMRTTQFAEEGKMGNSLVYVDGTYRERQSQAYINSDNTTMISEVMYDFEGRPVVSVLPYPIPSNGMNYVLGQNQFVGATSIGDKKIYDNTVTNSPALSTANGAAKYYSLANTSVQSHRDYIPSANGYAYTQIQYLQDGTGRVAKQNLAGDAFKLNGGTGKYLEYYYDNAKPNELYKLFGTNVGVANHYKKNYTKDNNGQFSVNYTDQFGNIVATALVGDTPKDIATGTEMLEGLTGVAASTVSVDLSTNNRFDKATQTYFLENTIVNIIPTLYTMNYSLSGVFSSLGNVLSTCATCVYDLDIKVYGPDGAVVNPTEPGPTEWLNLNPLSSTCNATTNLSPITRTYNFTQIGEYKIVKQLKLNSTAITTLTTTLESSPNAPKILTYQQKYNALIDYSQCDYSCYDRALTANPTWDPLSVSYVPGDYTVQINNWITTNCLTNIDLDEVANSECKGILAQIKLAFDAVGRTDYDKHPEYCHYLACIVEKPSKKYGYEMAAIRDWATATSKGYHNPLNSTHIEATSRGPVSKVDYLYNLPTEFTSGSFAIAKGVLEAKMVNYYVETAGNELKVDGTLETFSLWDITELPEFYGVNTWNALTLTQRSELRWRTFYALYLGLRTDMLTQLKKTKNQIWECAYQYPDLAIVKDPLLDLDKQGLDIVNSNNVISVCQETCKINVDEWMLNIKNTATAIGCPVLTTLQENKIRSLLSYYCVSTCSNNTNPLGLLIYEDWISGSNTWLESIKSYLISNGLNCYSSLFVKQAFLSPYTYTTSTQTNWQISSHVYQIINAINKLVNESVKLDNIITSCSDINPNQQYEIPFSKIYSGGGYYHQINIPVSYDWTNFHDMPYNSVTIIDDRSTLQPTFPYTPVYSDPCNRFEYMPIKKPYSFAVVKNIEPIFNSAVGACPLSEDQYITPVIYSASNPNLPNKKSQYSFIQFTVYPNVPQNTFFCSYLTDEQYIAKDLIIKVSNPTIEVINGKRYIVVNVIKKRTTNSTVIDTIKSVMFDNYDVIYNVNGSVYNPMTPGGTYIPNNNFVKFEANTTINIVTGLTPCTGPVVDPPNGPRTYCPLTIPSVQGITTLRSDCRNEQQRYANELAQLEFQQAMDNFVAENISAHIEKCFSASVNERLTLTYSTKEYHYTLYYYDQAGNLVATVPPEGVYPLPATAFPGGVYDGTNPTHTLHTYYRYNSIGQPIRQESPDAGVSTFVYDSKGQLRLSQNAKQAAASSTGNNQYSYSKYDALGRVTEVGQVNNVTQTGTTLANKANRKEALALVDNQSFPAASTSLVDVTRTVYDVGNANQSNLRNRVAVATTHDNATLAASTTTRYSYDIHGNVNKLYQTIGTEAERLICYKYDLISGLVKRVDYQPGKAEQFAHKYFYDADNRLRNVYTSRDNGYSWQEDAEYFYYLHGPLARVEYGDNKVQGMDYAYTINGWIKFGNLPHKRTSGLNTLDIGKDGTLPGDVNQYVGMDEFAFALGYHKTDYTPINASAPQGAATMGHELMQSNILANGLYNGNITWMATQLNNLSSLRADFMPDENGIRVGAYKYDQLNRLTKSRAYGYINNSGLATTALTFMHNGTTGQNRWRADYTYDANGNIKTAYVTNGSVIVDNLTYRYTGNIGPGQRLTTNNRLIQVTESVPAATIVGDIDPGQLTNNYTYDAIGNLIGDVQETSTIEWNVYGKVKKVTKSGGVSYTFTYDAAGNRVRKAVYSGTTLGRETFYIRAANGETIVTLTRQNGSPNLVAEYEIKGNTRLGTIKEVYSTTAIALAEWTKLSENRPDNTVYELTNHLGNVNAVISGLKIGVGTTSASTYKVRVMSLMDYYPFGMEIADRSYNDSYRYGFNGKEKDKNEWNAGSIYDYGFRIYDPRLGKFLSVDPLTSDYPWYTPYQFSGNKPICNIDLDGLEDFYAANGKLMLSGPYKIEYASQVIKKYENNISLSLKIDQSLFNVDITGFVKDVNRQNQIADNKRYLAYQLTNLIYTDPIYNSTPGPKDPVPDKNYQALYQVTLSNIAYDNFTNLYYVNGFDRMYSISESDILKSTLDIGIDKAKEKVTDYFKDISSEYASNIAFRLFSNSKLFITTMILSARFAETYSAKVIGPTIELYFSPLTIGPTYRDVLNTNAHIYNNFFNKIKK
ncbi:MAG: hypothetical protein MUE33_01310 [Cytophagaceae bacterium]|jgi:RHS repeat-associated protein|nr:hypothetical protein [Cytophagaceae bacterium]